MSRPDPVFLVDLIIQERGLAVIYGPPGAGKTFVALDLALSVATQRAWLGHRVVKSGQVIYITPEGLAGLKCRVQAWERKAQTDAPAFAYVCEAPQFLNPGETEALVECVKTSEHNQPVLIVIDTLARHMVGGDENSSQAMGEFVANVDRLREAFGCAILIVHHTGKSASGNFKERGSTALRGAADTMMLVTKKGEGIEILCDKQKDTEEFPAIHVRLAPVTLANGASSCAVELRSATGSASPQRLGPEKQKIVDVLTTCGSEGCKSKRIIHATGIAESSCYRHLAELVGLEILSKDDKSLYRLTDAYRNAAPTLKMLSMHSNGSSTALPSLPHPLRGGSGESEIGRCP